MRVSSSTYSSAQPFKEYWWDANAFCKLYCYIIKTYSTYKPLLFVLTSWAMARLHPRGFRIQLILF